MLQQEDYQQKGVNLRNKAEFLKVWKEDVLKCLQTRKDEERFISHHMKICMLLFGSKYVKSGEYQFKIYLEPPDVRFKVYEDMGFSLVIISMSCV